MRAALVVRVDLRVAALPEIRSARSSIWSEISSLRNKGSGFHQEFWIAPTRRPAELREVLAQARKDWTAIRHVTRDWTASIGQRLSHAAWERRAHRLEPDPETAHVVRWISAQRLAGRLRGPPSAILIQQT
jgi:hypothetical protein